MNTSIPLRKASAFTLVEMLVVVCILGILMALALTAVGTVRERSVEAKALVVVRQAAQVLTLYAQEHNNRLPKGWWTPSSERENGVQQTWQEQVAPYLYTTGLKNPGELRKRLRRTANSPLMDPGAPQPMNNEDMPSLGINANLNDNYWDGWRGHMLRVPHPSETILVGSRDVLAGSSDYLWSFDNPLFASMNPGLYHRGKKAGIFAFVDGHAETLSREALTPGTVESKERPELWRW